MPIRNENIDIYSDSFFQFLNEQKDKEEKTFKDSLKEFLEKENFEKLLTKETDCDILSTSVEIRNKQKSEMWE